MHEVDGEYERHQNTNERLAKELHANTMAIAEAETRGDRGSAAGRRRDLLPRTAINWCCCASRRQPVEPPER